MVATNEDFAKVVKFHGHACPGLAFGYRAAKLALGELGVERAEDEELIAIVENNSCAVDAIQVLAGCTFGKGNLFFRDYGKQVYTLLKRSSGEAVRLSVSWEPPPEDPETEKAWQAFMAGNRSPETLELARNAKKAKMTSILTAADHELFKIGKPKVEPPPSAAIHKSLTCRVCGEKVMEPKAAKGAAGPVCIPCATAGK
jgi:formylmethanofuran dehydrogenase subunit E